MQKGDIEIELCQEERKMYWEVTTTINLRKIYSLHSLLIVIILLKFCS
jgi:hypothetical protein